MFKFFYQVTYRQTCVPAFSVEALSYSTPYYCCVLNLAYLLGYYASSNTAIIQYYNDAVVVQIFSSNIKYKGFTS